MTWLETAVERLRKADEEIPDTVGLKERRKILSKLRTSGYSDTSWGRKVWPKAMRIVLARYYKSEATIPEKHLSPLERMMKRAGK